jgi:hypothetical protein
MLQLQVVERGNQCFVYGDLMFLFFQFCGVVEGVIIDKTI